MPEIRICPRCESCDHDEPHHWMEDMATLTGFGCKHCPAIAVECSACCGDGEVESEESEDGTQGLVSCSECDGRGLVEVVRADLVGSHVEREIKQLREELSKRDSQLEWLKNELQKARDRQRRLFETRD
jgi:phage/plasmid primase-like uncharacterized protein